MNKPAFQSRGKRVSSKEALFRIGEGVDKLVLLFLLGSVCLFVLWPMTCILLRSLHLSGGDGFTLSSYVQVWTKYQSALRNSLFIGIVSALLCTLFSVSAAVFLSTRRGWMKGLCMAVLLVCMVSPPFVSSLAYIQLYGRRGWITYRLLGLSWDPYNSWGVIWMQALSFVPMNALFLIGILSKLDGGSLRAARDLGARPGAILRDVVLPLMRPGILVCLLLSFVRSLADFGTPVIIGGRSTTLAAEIYLQVVGYSDLEKSSAMNMFLLVPSIAFFFLYRALMRRSDRLTEGARGKQESLSLPLFRCGPLGWLAVAMSLLFFVMMTLQYGCIFLSGFLKSTKGVYSFTLKYWHQLWTISGSTMVRSVIYSLIVSLGGTLFAMLFAYYMERRRVPGRSLFDCLVTLPYMLPGTCFGIGYILAFNHAPLKLTGTALIVMANMMFKQLPTSTKICSASLTQVPVYLEKAARDLGGGQMAVVRDVILPGLRPAFLSCFVYNFSSSMTTAGSIIFLIDPGRQLAVFKLFDAVYTGDYALASLIASAITVIVLAVEGLVFLISWKGAARRVS
ncbi:iron ABC transporter permease [Pseudoflavonifractor sp. MSJ-37]|uniref:ABC transporter permease n=1 Tax=Pseudoflavonifractor sp. MSJ-37 TaxID=2841531 RepID=UPI00209DC575|nr:iron ABC transporter permease [Pseudoflavonifractor sp. MSJ-37]